MENFHWLGDALGQTRVDGAPK